MLTIRGATSVENNSEKDILKETEKLLETIIRENNLKKEKVVSILFSATKDLNKAYPARAARKLGFTDIGLMCFQEMEVENSLESCIRLILFYNDEIKNIKHIYLNKAKSLRPDLVRKRRNSLSKNYIVAVDGPAASGKSTIAKKVAENLNIKYIDSGAMFRALTYYMLEKEIDLDKDKDISQALNKVKLSYDREGNILLNEKNIESQIRKNIVSQNVSKVASNADVRKYLLDFQREMGEKESIIMDGRDIGTAVFPNADFKFFLIASAEERAKRRHRDFLESGENVSFEEVLKDIKKRDEIDSTRKLNPLKKADDAIEIDSTFLSIDQVVSKIISHIEGDDFVL